MALKIQQRPSIREQMDEINKKNKKQYNNSIKGLTKDVIVEAEGKKVDYSKNDPLGVKKQQTTKKTNKKTVEDTLRNNQTVQLKQKQQTKQNIGTSGLSKTVKENTKRGYATTDSNAIMQNFANKTGSYDPEEYARQNFGTYQLPKKQESLGTKTLKTLGSIPVGMADFFKGAVLNTGEAIVDLAQRGEHINNWVYNKLGLMDDYERWKADQKIDENVARDLSGEVMRNLGWNEENERILKDYSYLTGNTAADKFIESLGEQAPTYFLGYAGSQYMTGGKGVESALTSLKGLRGKELFNAVVGNVGKASLLNSGANIPIALTSYNHGYEEALRSGATREQASRYGFLSAATEMVTEWTTGGIPGLENSTGFLSKKAGQLLDASTGNIKNEYLKPIAKSLLKYTGGAAGEGFEEALSEIISPYIKNATYTQGEKVNWDEVAQAALMGMASAGIFSFGQNLSEMAGEIKTVNQKNQVIKQIEQVTDAQIKELQQGLQDGDITQEEADQALNYLKAFRNQKILEIEQNYENRNGGSQSTEQLSELAQQQVEQIQKQVQSGEITPKEGMQQIKDIQDYLTARENSANALAANETAQDNINTQEQQNVAQNANNEAEQKKPDAKSFGDLGKGRDTAFARADGSRSTGHFGTGAYFVTEDYQPGKSSSYNDRPISRANLSDYNLYKPLTDRDGYNLHDGLKAINSRKLFNKTQVQELQESFNTYKQQLSDESVNNLVDVLEKQGYDVEKIKEDFQTGWTTRAENNLVDMAEDIIYDYDRLYKEYNTMIEQIKRTNPKITDETIEKAFEATNKQFEEYMRKGYDKDLESNVDSLSTIFMKNLGYEGIDVRHLEGLNNTTYGTVVYDLKHNEKEQNMMERTKEKITTDTIKATIAPYYDTPLTKNNYSEIKSKVDTTFKETANNIVNMLGGKIKQTTNNIGGFTFSEGENAGSWVKELSYTFELENMSREDGKLFSALMGDLAYEQQEAVIAATYADDTDSSNALEFRLKYKNREQLMAALDKLGIHDYTIDTNNKTLQLLEFDLKEPYDTAQKIIQLTKELGGDESDGKFTGIQSDYIDKDTREGIYKEWLETHERGKENRELYSLVEQAYKKVEGSQERTRDSSFSYEGMDRKSYDETVTKMRENKQQRETKAAEEKKVLAEKKGNNVITAENYAKDFQDAQTGKLDKKKLRKYVTTSNEATGMQKSIEKADLDRLTYEVQSNDKTYKKARKNLEGLSYEDRLSRSRNLLSSNKRITAVDVAEAQITLLEAAQSGNVQDYLDLQQDLAIMGTEAGQTIQAMSMIQKMSPDGQLQTLLKIIDRQQKLGNKNYENVKLNADLVQQVLDSYDDVNHTTFNKEKLDNAMDALKQDVADQMKVSWAEKANEWRYLSMLGNPKTHIRNMVGNVAMSLVKRLKDYQSAAAQDLLGKLGVIDKSNKTATLKRSSKDVKKLAKEYYSEFQKLEDSGSKYSEKANIEQQRRIFKPGLIEWIRKANLKALNVEDNWFKNFNYRKSFSNFLTAKGIRTEADIRANPQIVQDANNYAILQAKIATFQQNNKVADWIRQADKLGKGAEVVRGAIIPFTSVPMNIAQTGIEYTPGLGMFKTISDFKKAAPGDKAITLIDGIAKQTTGSALAIIGYALAKSGMVTADAGDDKEDKFEKDIGAKMNYSIKVGDKSYDLSWLSPSSMPFFVGASMYEQLEKDQGVSGNLITQALTSTLDPLSEMSVISSFFNVLDSYEKDAAGKIMKAGESTLQNYVSQYIPTAFSQMAKALDDKKRDTYASKNSPWAFGEETLKQLAYKIPGARNLLPEQKDFLGRTKKESYISDNKIVNAFEAFFSPVNVRKDTSNEVTRELIDIYNKTGGDSLIPNKQAYTEYFKYKKEKYDLSKKEYNEFKEDAGKIATEEIEKLINDSDYQKLSDDKKAKALANIMQYSRYKAKYDYFEDKGIDYYNQTFNSVREGIKNGEYSLSDYYLDKQSKNNERYKALEKKGVDAETFDAFKEFATRAKADKDKRGNSIPGSKKQKIINYIEGLDISKKAKEALYKDYKDNTKTFTTYK